MYPLGIELQLTHKVSSCIPEKKNVNLLRFIFYFLVPLQVRIYVIKVTLLYSSVKKGRKNLENPKLNLKKLLQLPVSFVFSK